LAGGGGDVDFYIRIWDVSSPSIIKSTLIAHTSRITSMAVMPNGDLLAANGNTFRVWDTTNAINTRTISITGSINCFAILNSGLWAIGVSNSQVRIYDSTYGFARFYTGPASVISLALLPNDYLASSFSNGLIRIWNYANGSIIRDINTGGYSTIKLLSLRTTQQILYNLGMPSLAIQISDTDDGSLIVNFDSGHTAEVNGLAQLLNGNVVSVSDDTKCNIRNSTYAVNRTITETNRLLAVAVLQSGRLAIAGCTPSIRITTV
jgi:WD40 repeat protein